MRQSHERQKVEFYIYFICFDCPTLKDKRILRSNCWKCQMVMWKLWLGKEKWVYQSSELVEQRLFHSLNRSSLTTCHPSSRALIKNAWFSQASWIINISPQRYQLEQHHTKAQALVMNCWVVMELSDFHVDAPSLIILEMPHSHWCRIRFQTHVGSLHDGCSELFQQARPNSF